MLLRGAPSPRPQARAASGRAGHTPEALQGGRLTPPSSPRKSTPSPAAAPRPLCPAHGSLTRHVSSPESRLILNHDKPAASVIYDRKPRGTRPPEPAAPLERGTPPRQERPRSWKENRVPRSIRNAGQTQPRVPVPGHPGSRGPGHLLSLPDELVPRGTSSACLTGVQTLPSPPAHRRQSRVRARLEGGPGRLRQDGEGGLEAPGFPPRNDQKRGESAK